MDNSGRAHWNQNCPYEPMRKPHARNDPSVSISTGQQPRASAALSPDAKVFVPRSSPHPNAQMGQVPHPNHGGHHHHYRNQQQQQQQQQQQHQRGSGLQDRLMSQQYPNNSSHYGHSRPNAPNSQHAPFNSVQGRIRKNHNNHQMYNQEASQAANYESSQGGNSQLTEEENFALSYITEIVKCLNDDPGLFDSFESHLLKVFDGFGDSQFILSNAMEIIFVQSIEEQNFRYMGAKLYRLLDSINPQRNSAFRTLLNFKLTYHQDEVLNYMQNEQNKVRATTLFLAELYMQLRNDPVMIKEIAKNIIHTITQLLQKPTPENIKCICLTLKLSGYELETDFPADVHDIIENLSKKVDNIDVGTSRVLETVLLLQKNNWGRNENTNHSSPVNESAPNYSDLPVFYGPDGQVMTEEENSFLESHMPQDGDADNDCDLDSDPEMDAEIESAYEDFLKQQPNKS